MNRRNSHALPHRDTRLRRRKAEPHRPAFEPLEDRTMLASGPATSGRDRDRADAGDAVDGRYGHAVAVVLRGRGREQPGHDHLHRLQRAGRPGDRRPADDRPLEPGVTLAGASQPPDQSGQNLAWSLGTIEGYDRASVSITVNLPSPSHVAARHRGAGLRHARRRRRLGHHARRDAARGERSDPSLLASTPDANTTDPFIQEEAAKLDYDPTADLQLPAHPGRLQLLSRLGPRRRGTLWSDAGNALDVASLGVALMRASGIPAQYVAGTLSQDQAQQLILSMFPASYQTVGYVPAGTQTADPAQRPATAVRDRDPLLVPVRHRRRHEGRRPADGRRRGRPGVHGRHGHVHRGARRPAGEDRGAAHRRDLQPGRRGLRRRACSRTQSSWTRRSTTWTWWAGPCRSGISSIRPVPDRSSAR